MATSSVGVLFGSPRNDLGETVDHLRLVSDIDLHRDDATAGRREFRFSGSVLVRVRAPDLCRSTRDNADLIDVLQS